MKRFGKAAILAACLAAMIGGGALVYSQQEKAAPPELPISAKIDRVFERWNRSDTPGCVVAVAVAGQPPIVRAYGMANLEYGLRINPDTIFESGSVAKQFTAAAIALLVQDGRISLDDPVRKYLPEVPDFGAPILIRHFLNHTSGLRSQWTLLSLAGRAPGSAVHTHAEILELVGRMKELNFPPGEEFLYNNTGYTLLGIIVQRASGKSLAEFTREKLFVPLGMTRTEWREDFMKIVPGRATAYRQERDGSFRTYMPFTNVHGNGGLLTTVGDLLVWNENLNNPRIGGRALVDQLQTQGRLNDGFENEYAQGLFVTSYKGIREISHGGSTAGYQTFLARFPDERLSIAVLSNVTSSAPARLAHNVAEIFLAGKLKEPAKPVPVILSVEALRKFAGTYKEPATDAVLSVEVNKEGKALLIASQPATAISGNTFVSADASQKIVFEPGAGSLRMRLEDGRSKPRLWEWMPVFAPKPEQLAAYTGIFYSEEIDTAYEFYVEKSALKVRFRPAMRFDLTPVYEDAFEGDGNIVRFTRNPAGAVTGFLVYAGRVRHLRFTKR